MFLKKSIFIISIIIGGITYGQSGSYGSGFYGLVMITEDFTVVGDRIPWKDADSQPLAVVNRGEIFKYEELTIRCLRLIINGRSGYITENYQVMSKDEILKNYFNEKYVEITVTQDNIREGSSSKEKIIKKCKKGEKYSFLGWSGKWYCIIADNNVAFTYSGNGVIKIK